jgi:hypothetical protein
MKPIIVCLAALAAAPAFAAPSVEQFKQALDAQMQKLKPGGNTERTVLFQEVRAGKPEGGTYPFQVTGLVHDYGPGFPKNQFYGETCVGKMDKQRFDLRDDGFGGWVVQGRMTLERDCKRNPSAGVSATPVASLPGTPMPKAVGTAPPAQGTKVATDNPRLPTGEYACYGTGGRLMAGMGFRLNPDGSYVDLDSQRGGRYDYNGGAATVAFRGGFLDGQSGKNVRPSGFQLSSTVHCEPWK